MRGLINPQLKTARAMQHLKRLRQLLKTHREQGAYTTKEFDFTTRDGLELFVFRLTLNPCSVEIPITIGEYAYSLRSALDQLAWQLALLKGGTPPRKTAFPIFGSLENGGAAEFKKATNCMPAEAAAILRELQPFARGETYKTHPLWQLNQLCNIDKHSTMAVNSTSVDIETGPPGEPHIKIYENDLEDGRELAVLRKFKGQIYFKPKMAEMIFGRPMDEPGPQFEVSESELTEMLRFVRHDIIPRFSGFFPLQQRGIA